MDSCDILYIFFFIHIVFFAKQFRSRIYLFRKFVTRRENGNLELIMRRRNSLEHLDYSRDCYSSTCLVKKCRGEEEFLYLILLRELIIHFSEKDVASTAFKFYEIFSLSNLKLSIPSFWDAHFAKIRNVEISLRVSISFAGRRVMVLCQIRIDTTSTSIARYRFVTGK